MLGNLFARRKEHRYSGEQVDLIMEQEAQPSAFNDGTHSIYYGIYLRATSIQVGNCDLRIGSSRSLYYAGNIGYSVFPEFRGCGYAYEACRVLMPIARDVYGLTSLIITCSPENIASRKTLEKLNGRLLEVADVPSDHWLYKRGETVKNIYEYEL